MSNPLIDSLLRSVEAAPEDVVLRLHLAGLLVADGRAEEAVRHCAVALQHQPDSDVARELMTEALTPPTGPEPAPGDTAASPERDAAAPPEGDAAAPPEGDTAALPEGDAEAPTEGDAPAPPEEFDWQGAEQQFTDGPPPMFVQETSTERDDAHRVAVTPEHEQPAGGVWEVEQATTTLADVGGMEHVKHRLEVSFLAPMRNPELRKLYAKSLRGGLLLYGPPGCGKTFIARAVAGEMGAGFINVTLSDVLDMYLGQSEGNLHELFQLARRKAPAVLFLDEVDAIGQKRTQTRFSGMRTVVNQLLQELDGVGSENEGVYVLAATNAPWDVDPALRRPGRLDRSVLVLPPDEEARATILRRDLARRPVEGIDLGRLARMTDGLTGADLTHLCEGAAEIAMSDSVRSGRPRLIGMRDLKAASKDVRPSAKVWFDAARNVVTYADRSGEYDELREYMRRTKLL